MLLSDIAVVYEGMGETGRALDWLEDLKGNTRFRGLAAGGGESVRGARC